MTSDHVDLNRFIVALFEAAYRGIKVATDGLTDEQLYYQPTADTNSMAWLVWHLSRCRDCLSSTISGEPQVWVAESWAKRFGMHSEQTGIGDTPEQVAAFRVDRDMLFGYLDAAHRAAVERISKITPKQFEQPIEYLTGDTRPAWRGLVGICGDSSQHNGQIAYLRGMITGHGWRRRVGLH